MFDISEVSIPDYGCSFTTNIAEVSVPDYGCFFTTNIAEISVPDGTLTSDMIVVKKQP
jgi:hypothetical protein